MARYRWSEQGWTNDWVMGLDTTSSAIRWNLEVHKPGTYRCDLRYNSAEGTATILVVVADQYIKKELPAFSPVPDRNLRIRASDPCFELLSVTLLQAADSADVIVYGGTSAAVTAAVQVARMGKNVIVVSPDRHLSIRMEPVFMILGQSAATLAVTALEQEKDVHEVAYRDVRARLLEDGQVLEY